MPDPSLKKMILNRDVPLFSGVVKAGTEVSVIRDYISGSEMRLVNVQAGFLRIDGLDYRSLSEKTTNFPF